MKWRGCQARIAAYNAEDGTALAQAAVALAERSDDPSLTGEALTALAETLEAAGDADAAASARDRAVDAFESKGNVAAVRALASQPAPRGLS